MDNPAGQPPIEKRAEARARVLIVVAALAAYLWGVLALIVDGLRSWGTVLGITVRRMLGFG